MSPFGSVTDCSSTTTMAGCLIHPFPNKASGVGTNAMEK